MGGIATTLGVTQTARYVMMLYNCSSDMTTRITIYLRGKLEYITILITI